MQVRAVERYLEDAASFLVDESRDALDAAATSQTSDCRLGDALDVVAQHFSVPFGATFAESLATFASACTEKKTRHRGTEKKGLWLHYTYSLTEFTIPVLEESMSNRIYRSSLVIEDAS